MLASVMFLFAAETFAGNLVEATIHGKTLQTLLHQKSLRDGPDSIEQGFLTRALWYDVHLSGSHMTPTIFDMNGWVMDELGPVSGPWTRSWCPSPPISPRTWMSRLTVIL